MAYILDFGCWYEICNHWSNLCYPRKDSTRYPRQVGPIGRTLRTSTNVPLSVSIRSVSSDDMTTESPPSWCCGTFPVIANSGSGANINAWRNFYEVLDTQAVPHLDNHPLQDQPYSCTMDPCRTLRIPRTCCTEKLWKFWIGQAEIFIWIWSKTYGKRMVLHQTSINPNTIVCNLSDLCFEVHQMWNDIPRASTRHLIHSCRHRVRNPLAALGDFIGYWRFILQL